MRFVEASVTAVRTIAAALAFALMLCVLAVGVTVSGVVGLASSMRG
jgi:hypothetical protein